MKRRVIAITGIGTSVGKTCTAAIIAHALRGTYWKPVESGTETESDTRTLSALGIPCKEPTYALRAPLSPHQAAEREGVVIERERIKIPRVERPLIIETAGGLLVPLNDNTLALDLFLSWDPLFVIVSNHYLGSINHTLLTISSLRQHNAKILGIVFNGLADEEKERAILRFGELKKIGNLLPESQFNMNTLKKYALQWKEPIDRLLKETEQPSGTPTPRCKQPICRRE